MQTGVILAIALIPVYIVVLSAIINVFLYKTRPAFRSAFINPSHRIPATIRYLLPYPFSAYGLNNSTTASTDSGSGEPGNRRETRQRTELRPVTLPPVVTSSTSGTSGQSSTVTGSATTGTTGRGGRSTNRNTERVITRGGRRWGRTGSQRSTQTLPLYSEDVGDEDVVLIAKRESMRSMRSTRSRTAAEDEDIEEEGEELEDESQDEEASPDLEDQQISTGTALSAASAAEPNQSNRRERSESIVSSTSIYDRGWGEAPAYEDATQDLSQMSSSFRPSLDTVDRADRSTDMNRVTTGGSQTPLNTASAPRDSAAAGTGAGFRSFVSRLTGRLPASGLAGRYSSVGPELGDAEIGQGGPNGASSESFAMTGRARGFSDASGMSQLTVDSAAPRPSVSSGMTRLRSHTGIASANNSLVSLLLHPTISNQSATDGGAANRFYLRGRSGSIPASVAADPSSPSASVVNLGISPPLPGSVIRSAYNQPRAGFSTEQLKFLSSTESLGKYGANFGPDDAALGIGPSSHLHTTRTRSGSASSVGAIRSPGHSSHRRAQSSSTIIGNADLSNEGLPTFEDLIREEEVAEEQRRGNAHTNQVSESVATPVAQSSEEAIPEDAQLPNTQQNETQSQLPTLQLPLGLPNFDLEVVPPTPVAGDNRRSFLNGQSVA